MATCVSRPVVVVAVAVVVIVAVVASIVMVAVVRLMGVGRTTGSPGAGVVVGAGERLALLLGRGEQLRAPLALT